MKKPKWQDNKISKSARWLGLISLALALLTACNNEDGNRYQPDISSQLPEDVIPHFSTAQTDEYTNNDFDYFSWQVFIALNWPAADSGTASELNIGEAPSAFRVWEYFTDSTTPFDTSSSTENSNYTSAILSFTSRDSLQARSLAPLVDLNGNYFLYSASINDVMVDYLTINNLTTAEGLASFGTTSKALFFPTGSMELKQSWRIFPDDATQDLLDRYYVRNAQVIVSDDDSDTGEGFTINNLKIGLIAMHITYKTPNFDTWVWSTFEHVDLTQGEYIFVEQGEIGNITSNRVPNEVATGEAPKSDEDINDIPTYNYKWLNPSTSGQPMAGLYENTLIARAPNEGSLPESMNQIWQEVLPHPWANYQLVATQRMNQSGDNAAPLTDGEVSIVRNIASETYIIADLSALTHVSQVPAVDRLDACQENPESSRSIALELALNEWNYPNNDTETAKSNASCMACHGYISFKYGANDEDVIFTDYSYIFVENITETSCDD
ncbi:hypothetical protein [uncultured Shewanella sp.]|uniref:hypothetical protein n=1 Tax=uncultured Shewanella sp. TaxID=173975 RepID=UPI00262EE634|nr:hypothetical protein [uncultured Shewanella sp.]